MDIKKITFFAFLAAAFAAVFYGGLFYGANLVVCETCQPSTINFSLFWEAYNQLQQKFFDPSKITEKQVLYGAITGMAEELGDPYTTFFDPVEAKKFTDELSGYFGGVGMEIGIKKDQLTIIAPLEGTPAQGAGLRAGDIIMKIGDKSTVSMATDEAVNLIRGTKGTSVILTIFRSGWSKTKEFTIIRDTIKIPTLKLSIIDGDTANLRIYQFSQSLVSDFNKAALDIVNNPEIKKIVLDLRNNPGGYLEVSQNIAGWFLEKGQTVVIEDFGGNKEQKIYKAEGNAGLMSYPVVILINQGTASASEILAGALKDNRNIKLIGEKSFGKGSVQEAVILRDSSFLKITIAKWLTPNGASISEKGLDPDVKIEITDKDYEEEKDPQLDKAIEILKSIQ